MSDQRSSEVLGGLPNSRPHRRSQKRPARPAESSSEQGSTSARTSSTKTAKPTAKRTSTPRASSTAKATGSPAPKAKGSSTAGAKGRATAGRKATGSSAPRQGARLEQPKQPTGTPSGARSRKPAQQPQSGGRHEILETAVQAAAELAEIGFTVSARALRSAISRLPRP